MTEPTSEQIRQSVEYLRERIRGGWVPPIDFRLRMGLDQAALQRIRESSPPEPELLE